MMFLATREEAPQVTSEGTPRAVSRGAPRVVVVGGGIGGVAVANGLA
ncbi:MAG TPA: NAD(P)/FAD-dependent oxidoreductase, partial [Firmicutes bacterium]|nr:NAD(P)/FAD-dependent oxidoreductase [Bacillota bacterium]